MNEEEKQQKFMELQILNQRGEQLRQYLAHLLEQIENLKRLKENLEAIEKEKNGAKMFSPLSSGVFVKTELKDNKEVLIGVGAGVVVRKDIKDAKEMLIEQESKMELVINQVKEELQKFLISASRIEEELSVE